MKKECSSFQAQNYFITIRYLTKKNRIRIRNKNFMKNRKPSTNTVSAFFIRSI